MNNNRWNSSCLALFHVCDDQLPAVVMITYSECFYVIMFRLCILGLCYLFCEFIRFGRHT